MTASPGDRLLASLPAVYQQADESGDLAALLGVFETLFFGDPAAVDPPLPGIERTLLTLPGLFAPLGSLGTAQDAGSRTPEPFLHWLASWLAFTPHPLFSADALRRIIAGIVPLYGLRGTRQYLIRLLELCFDDIQQVQVDDRPLVGFRIGDSMLGSDTRLGVGRAFWFKVAVELKDAGTPGTLQDGGAALERRLRAVIDFAKPAHTAYELRVKPAVAKSEEPGWHEHSG